MKDTKITYTIEEARRYVANAEETIKKAKYDPEIQSYIDSKYVRTAGNAPTCYRLAKCVLRFRLIEKSPKF